MSPVPDPFGLQPGPVTPTGSVTPRYEGASPPFPPHPNHLPPDSSRFPQPERADAVPNLSNQHFYTSSNTPYGNAREYIPHSQATAWNAEPSSRGNKPFSFRSALGQFAKAAIFGHAGPAPFTPSYSSGVTVNGVELGQADLVNLQTQVGPVSPGTYWYDRRCGAFGFIGGPCRGFIPAGLGIGGGQLAGNASGNTGTKVFINGREIHAMDVLSLQGMGVMVMPGNWWLNSDGTYGFESNPIPLGNLRLQAAAAGGGGSGGWGGGWGGGTGGAHTWSTSMGHYGGTDGQGFTYIGGPGWSWSN